MKYLVVGNYGADNLGDEMILEGLIASFKKIDKAAEITVLSGNPNKTALMHGVRSFPMFPSGFRSYIKNLFAPSEGQYKSLRECNYFVLGGGGLFGDLTKRAYIIWNTQCQRALKMNKKIIMYGQSVGPIKKKWQEKIVKNLFNQAHFVAVRDQESANELKRIGVERKVHVMPDLALRTGIKSKKGDTTIVAPHYCLKDKEVIKDFAREHKARVINFHPRDKGITGKGKTNYSIKDVHNEYKSANIVVGMRLHSIITAVKHGKAFIAINYSQKVKNFATELGLEDQVLETNEIKNLGAIYEKTLKNKAQIEKKIAKYLSDSEKKLNEIEQTLKSQLQQH